MKDNFRWMTGIVCGILCFTGGQLRSDSISLADVICNAAFSNTICYINDFPEVVKWFLPLLVFQLLYGVYLYRHFCSASVYYFSRTKNRKKWFLKEARKMYGFTLLYLAGFVSSGIVVSSVHRTFVTDWVGILLTVYYIVIFSMYLFVTTAWINLLAIRFGGVVGAGVVTAANILGMACYSVLGNLAEQADPKLLLWFIRINPICHLVFPLHSSQNSIVNSAVNVYGYRFDLNLSVAVFAALSAVTLFAGCRMCEKYEFLRNNREGE